MLREMGFDGVYYIDALGTGLFRCFDREHPADEKAFALGQQKILGWARAVFGASATETPAVYTLKYVDYGGNGVHRHFRVNLSVDGNGGSDTAGADTAQCVQRKQAVFRGFARFYA